MENRERIFGALKEQYNITVTKKELAQILSCSISSVDKCLMKGKGLPNYKRLGNSRNSKIVWNLADIADFLSQTTKVYHC